MSIIFPISTPVLDKLSVSGCMAVHACELHFKDEIFRAHTGSGELVIDGYTYMGVGELGSVGNVTESKDSQGTYSVDLTISGLDVGVLSNTTVKSCAGRFGRLYFAVFDENGNSAADVLVSGRMGAARPVFGTGDTENTVTISIHDRRAEWAKPGTERFTNESHKARFPADNFFQYQDQIASATFYWGSTKDAPSMKTE